MTDHLFFFSGIVIFIIGLNVSVLGLSDDQTHQTNGYESSVVASSVWMKNSPFPSAVNVKSLKQGQSVTIIDCRPWDIYLVLADGVKGWVTGSALAIPVLWRKEYFQNVVDLIADMGIDTERLERIIGSSKVKLDKTVLDINLHFQLTPAHFERKISEYAFKQIASFMEQHQSIFHASYQEFPVPAEIISSILWLETELGNYQKLCLVINVYLNLVALQTHQRQEQVLEYLKNRFPNVAQAELKMKIEKRMNWAVDQLYYLLQTAESLEWDLLSLYGGWSGEVGWCQFIPQNIWEYAWDGNQDGIVNLDDPHDVIYSVANFLYSKGYSNESDYQIKALLEYNSTPQYGKTVLQLARHVNPNYEKP